MKAPNAQQIFLLVRSTRSQLADIAKTPCTGRSSFNRDSRERTKKGEIGT
jgi:hypothetical protein